MTRIVYYLIILLTLYIPFEEFIEKWIPIGSLYDIARYGGELLLIGLFILTISWKILVSGRLYKTPIDKPIIVFLCIAIFSAIINDTPVQVALLGLRPILRYAILYYILTQIPFPSSYYNRLLIIMIASAILVSVIGITQTAIGMPLTNILIPRDVTVGETTVREGLRHVVAARTYIFSTMGRYDTLGTFITIFILLAVSIYLYENGELRKLSLGLLIVGAPVLALTFSRQSWVATVIGLCTIVFLGQGKKLTFMRLVFIFSGLIIALILLVMIPNARYLGTVASANASIIERLLEPFSERYLEVSRYNYGRLYVIFEVGSRLLSKVPWLGFGPGKFGSLTARYFGYDFTVLINVPESAATWINDVNWITLLGQIGVLGLASFVWIWAALSFYSINIYKKTTTPLIKSLALFYTSAIVVYLFLGFFGPNFEVRQISYYVWSLGGILFGLYRNEKLYRRTSPVVNPMVNDPCIGAQLES